MVQVATTAFRRRFAARRGGLLQGIEEAVGFLSDHDLTPRTRHAVELALEELLTNVEKYAYPETTSGEVELSLEAGPEGILLEVVDDGRPFDPTAVPPPPPMTLDAPRGGRGLHLVRSLSRSMRYRREAGRNVVRVEFPPR